MKTGTCQVLQFLFPRNNLHPDFVAEENLFMRRGSRAGIQTGEQE